MHQGAAFYRRPSARVECKNRGEDPQWGTWFLVRSERLAAKIRAPSADSYLHPPAGVLGQLFLGACVLATLSIGAILFILFGPVPVKRRVTVLPRLSSPVTTHPLPSLVAQLAPAPEQHFSPSFGSTIQGAPPPYAAAPSTRSHTPPPLPIAATPPPVPMRKPKGAKVQPMPRKRAAKGTDSPFAPVVRRREVRDEDVRTNPVRRVMFESEEFTTVDES
jgi:hypothetical protein